MASALVGGGQGRAGALEEQLARVGQIDATGVAREQRDPELGLQPPDLRGEPGLGDPQALGGAREASLLGDRDEVAQMTQLHGAHSL